MNLKNLNNQDFNQAVTRAKRIFFQYNKKVVLIIGLILLPTQLNVNEIKKGIMDNFLDKTERQQQKIVVNTDQALYDQLRDRQLELVGTDSTAQITSVLATPNPEELQELLFGIEELRTNFDKFMNSFHASLEQDTPNNQEQTIAMAGFLDTAKSNILSILGIAIVVLFVVFFGSKFGDWLQKKGGDVGSGLGKLGMGIGILMIISILFGVNIKDIPLVGALFSGTMDRLNATNIVVAGILLTLTGFLVKKLPGIKGVAVLPLGIPILYLFISSYLVETNGIKLQSPIVYANGNTPGAGIIEEGKKLVGLGGNNKGSDYETGLGEKDDILMELHPEQVAAAKETPHNLAQAKEGLISLMHTIEMYPNRNIVGYEMYDGEKKLLWKVDFTYTDRKVVDKAYGTTAPQGKQYDFSFFGNSGKAIKVTGKKGPMGTMVLGFEALLRKIVNPTDQNTYLESLLENIKLVETEINNSRHDGTEYNFYEIDKEGKKKAMIEGAGKGWISGWVFWPGVLLVLILLSVIKGGSKEN